MSKVLQLGDDGNLREVDLGASDAIRRLAEIDHIGVEAQFAQTLLIHAGERNTQLSPLNNGRDQRGQR